MFEGGLNYKEPLEEEYQYYDSWKERHDIYEFSKELAEYLHREEIKRIIFVDRSARLAWVGVDEYWKQHFSKEERPDYYFLNPDAFNGETKNDIPEDDEISSIIDLLARALMQKDPYLQEENAGQNPISKSSDFKARYKKIAQSLGDSLAVFDTCAHSGKTLTPIINMLHNGGFTDVRVLTANEPDDISGVATDVKLDVNTLMQSCYPFGRASGVEKGWDMTSHARKNSRTNVIRARKEIRRILREGPEE